MRIANARTKSVRQSELLDLLRTQDAMLVSDLARRMQISLATLRRDLEELAVQGLVRRKFGSVELISASGDEIPFSLRKTQRTDEKKRIARAALDLIENGDTIYLSSGTTALELAALLPGQRRLTVITNALRVANVLADKPGIDLMLLGGALRPGEQTLHGPLTEWGAQQFRATKMFYGVEAISARQGITHSQVIEVNSDRAISRMVNQVVILADHTKFNKVAAVSVISTCDIHVIITGKELDRKTAQEWEANRVRVILV